MSQRIRTEEFLEVASRLEGQRLATAARRAEFVVNVLPNAIEVVPVSTNRPRRVPASSISRFLEEYNSSGIQRPGHYQEITFDASYLLAILSYAHLEVR